MKVSEFVSRSQQNASSGSSATATATQIPNAEYEIVYLNPESSQEQPIENVNWDHSLKRVILSTSKVKSFSGSNKT